MKNYIVVSIMFIFSLITVSSLARAEVVTGNAESANLVIYRPDDGSSLSYRFWVDGHYMGTLERDESFAMTLSEGEHEITANDYSRTALIVTVGEYGVTYVRSEVYRKVSMSLAVDTPDTTLDGVVAGL